MKADFKRVLEFSLVSIGSLVVMSGLGWLTGSPPPPYSYLGGVIFYYIVKNKL